MPQASFAYGNPANDGPVHNIAGRALSLTISIFADRDHVRATMRDDARAAGFRVAETTGIAALLEGEGAASGDVVLVDCPVVDGAALAALARLDVEAARRGARLVISTGIEALDDVFACMDLSRPEILVSPGRAERVIALGRVLARAPRSGVRELSEDDRLMLLRLTEQVGRIAERLERLEGRPDAAGSFDPGEESAPGAFGFESPRQAFRSADSSARLVRATRPPLPDPRLVRRIIRQRQLRARYFDGDLFADPAWDMLLDLTAARVEHTRVSVTSLCIASGVPPTTALRWIGQMTGAGLFQRVEDETDRRRAFIALTDKAADLMARYFSDIGGAATQLA